MIKKKKITLLINFNVKKRKLNPYEVEKNVLLTNLTELVISAHGPRL